MQAALRSQHVVGVFDVLEVGHNPALLMEYVEGPTLEDALQRVQFTLRQAEVLFRGTLEGVKAAHELGLVHRDLKPANVLLANATNGVVPKVADFGIAKVADERGSTRVGIAMGTPSYMAPEQIRDAGSVDHRADIFSLGCILYELVTHHQAFPQHDVLDIYNAISRGEYISPRQLNPSLPKRFAAAIRGALTVDKEQRIPNCDVLMEVFEGRRPWHMSGVANISDEPIVETSGSFGVPLAPGSTVLPVEVLEDLASQPDDLKTDDLRTDVTSSSNPLTPSDDLQGVDPADTIYPGEETTPSRKRWIVAALLLCVVGGAALVGSELSTGEAERPAPTQVATAGALPPERAETKPATSAPVSSSTSTPSEHDATAGAAPEPTPVSEPVEASPASAPAAATRPAPSTTKSRVKPPSKTKRRATPPEDKIAPKSTKAPSLPPAPQTVRLLSIPRIATLQVDGASQVNTPQKLQLAPGTHTVKLNAGNDTKTFTINVREGSENKWCFVLAEGKKHAGGCP